VTSFGGGIQSSITPRSGVPSGITPVFVRGEVKASDGLHRDPAPAPRPLIGITEPDS
jgi:hypothetical protein